MVAIGTLFSSFWILAANSWMQTPASYATSLVNGQFFAKDWFQVIFSPSFPYRFANVVVGFFVTAGFVVLGVGAYLVRREPSAEEGRTKLSMTLWLLTVLVPLQMVIGDQHGLNTGDHQPAKLAAIVARWETERRVLSYLGIAISLYPMIVPHHFTLWQAASSDRTQAFVLVGTLVLLPVILMYTGWSYWVFRGKVRNDLGYH